jgi:hypothetical protein
MSIKIKTTQAAVLIIGVFLLLISLLGLELQRSYDREVENAEAATSSVARLLERELLASVGKIDLIAQEAKFQYENYLNGSGTDGDSITLTLQRLLEVSHGY